MYAIFSSLILWWQTSSQYGGCVFCRLKAYYIVVTCLDSFRNKSGKPQLIGTKVGTHAQVKGRQWSRNFGRDRLSGAEMGGAQKCPRRLCFVCQQAETTFRQLGKGRFSPNLTTTRESRLKRRFRTEIYKFPFRGHLLPKSQTWRGANS